MSKVDVITGAGRGMGVELARAAPAAGADAAQATEQKAHTLLAQLDAHRDRSVDLAHDEPTTTVSL